jgi:hypothetical protein
MILMLNGPNNHTFNIYVQANSNSIVSFQCAQSNQNSIKKSTHLRVKGSAVCSASVSPLPFLKLEEVAPEYSRLPFCLPFAPGFSGLTGNFLSTGSGEGCFFLNHSNCINELPLLETTKTIQDMKLNTKLRV